MINAIKQGKTMLSDQKTFILNLSTLFESYITNSAWSKENANTEFCKSVDLNKDNYDQTKEFLSKARKSSFQNTNILSNIIFVTNDLPGLIKNLEKFNVNQGIQKSRGQINSMADKLVTIDKAFRLSMYNHALYHDDYIFNYNDFSSKNIHMNLGYRRY